MHSKLPSGGGSRRGPDPFAPIKPRPGASWGEAPHLLRRPVGRLCETGPVRGVAEDSPAPGTVGRGGVAALGRRLAAGAGREDSLRHLRVLPRREALTTSWPEWS